ncbi:MAG TPA: putative toxin-antitoxin system toxin component, PIN family [bacterium]|nr:putative toxin-antitoxin system toxin component, PIN family [bacterium]
MKIVLDTNVLISGFFPKKSPPTIILDMIIEGIITICYTNEIFIEYQEVLNRKKFVFIDKHRREIVLNYIKNVGYLVSGIPTNIILPDRDDEKFIEAAFAGQAQYIVTGNQKHYPEKHYNSINVILPADFLKEIQKKGYGRLS